MKTREDVFQTYGFAGLGKVTLALIAASVVVTLLIRLGANTELVSRLSVAAVSTGPGGSGFYRTDLAEVRAGEVWRLVTPIFMHFSLLHILFNMMWLRDLGSMIEGRRGAVFLLGFVAAVGVASNLAQFYVSGPLFGGMSGVVYGLLGYVWMQSRFNPWSGFVLHPTTVRMMLIWFVICLTGLVGPIANMAHAGGLVAGVLWGYVDARRRVPE
jgi:membrane associated rhomboid family serine protease